MKRVILLAALLALGACGLAMLQRWFPCLQR